MHLRETVSDCQALCERHIPLLMRVGGDLFDGGAKGKKAREPLTDAEERELMRRYLDPEQDTVELAEEFDITVHTLRNLASKNGVRRPRYENR